MHEILRHLAVPGAPILEKILRPILVYIFLLVALRLAGRRELAQLNPFDLVVLLMLSNAVQNAIIGDDNSVSGGVIGASTLLAINYLTVRFVYKHRAHDHTTLNLITADDPLPLIQQGRLLRENLDRQFISETELLAVCRRQGVDRLDLVETAVLETSGMINVIPKHPTPDEESNAQLAARLDRIERLLSDRRGGTGPDGADGGR